MKKVWKPVSDAKYHQICNERDIDKQKDMMKDIVYNFVHKGQQRKFLYDIDKPSYNKAKDLMMMITSLKLIVEGQRVV
jgi:hypothetical protein